MVDRLTKEVAFDSSKVGRGSEWNDGLPWMHLPTHELKSMLNSFEKVELHKEQEVEYRKACIDEPHVLDTDYIDMVAVAHESAKRQPNSLLIDLVYFGWKKSVRILGRVHYFIKKLRHRAGKCQSYCILCKITLLPMTSCENMAELYLFRNET